MFFRCRQGHWNHQLWIVSWLPFKRNPALWPSFSTTRRNFLMSNLDQLHHSAFPHLFFDMSNLSDLLFFLKFILLRVDVHFCTYISRIIHLLEIMQVRYWTLHIFLNHFCLQLWWWLLEGFRAAPSWPQTVR